MARSQHSEGSSGGPRGLASRLVRGRARGGWPAVADHDSGPQGLGGTAARRNDRRRALRRQALCGARRGSGVADHLEGTHPGAVLRGGVLCGGGRAPAPARLVRTPQGWEFRIGVHGSVLGTRMKEMAMATEGVVARVGRVMAGMANSVVDMAEQANPEAMVAQALREIDGAI